MAVTFPTSPTNGQQVTADDKVYTYSAAEGVWNITANTVDATSVVALREEVIATEGQTSFAVTYNPDYPVAVTVNGLEYLSSDFTATSGTAVVMNEALAAGDEVVIKYSQIETAGVDLSAITESIVPDTDVAYDLGSSDKKFRDLYLSGNSIILGDTTISASGGELQVAATGETPAPVGGGGVTVYPSIDDLPSSGQEEGDLAYSTADSNLLFWNGTEWRFVTNTTTAIQLYYLVAGGGGSGRIGYNGAGGGAGGVRTNYGSSFSGGGSPIESGYEVARGDTITVVVGAGQTNESTSGNFSKIILPNSTEIQADGGGGSAAGAPLIGQSGGCGGGGGGDDGSRAGGSGTVGQGYEGGYGGGSGGQQNNGGGGGGGAGAPGENGSNVTPTPNAGYGNGGNGGNGLSSSISGIIAYYAGGGGGTGHSSGGGEGNGGQGGGGDATRGGSGQAGALNSGGGGGAGSSGFGAGGSGVVILRSALMAAATTGNPTEVLLDGGDYLYTFTGSGSVTY